MSVGILATLMTSLAVAGAYFFTPRDDKKMAFAIGFIWIAALFIAFFSPQRSLTFLAIALMLGVTGAMSPRGAVFLYIGVLAALPLKMSYFVPFPGLAFLINVDYAKVATLALLGPAFLRGLSARTPPYLKSVDNLILFFVLFTSVMAFRDVPFTSVMRLTVDQMLLIYIPYIAISRTLKTQKDIDWAIRSFFICILIAALIGVITALRSWNYYSHLSDIGSGKAYFDYRNGILRVGATMNGSLLALFCGAGLAYIAILRTQKTYPLLISLAVAAILAFATFATGARGGWIAAIVCFGLFWIFNSMGVAIRRLVLSGMTMGVFVGFFLIFNESSLFEDKYGSINYRAELIRTSVIQIQDRPFFGSSSFMDSPRFAHLRQGEGIIDLVNGYLQVVLFFGIVGLGAFVGAHIIALRSGLRALSKLPPGKIASNKERHQKCTLAFLLALQLGYLTMIATISFTGQNQHFGYVFLGFVVAQARVLLHAPRSADERLGPETEVDLQAGNPEPSRETGIDPQAYGARFVRRT